MIIPRTAIQFLLNLIILSSAGYNIQGDMPNEYEIVRLMKIETDIRPLK